MLNNITVNQTKICTTNDAIGFFQDPLEQFDVLAISLPVVSAIGFTNLAILLVLNVAVMAS